MKILGISASPRRNKSTGYLLERCLEEISATSAALGTPIETQRFELAGKNINGCIACDKCKKGLVCSQDDDFQELIPQLADSEVKGLVIATPVYLGSMTSQAKAFLDRTVMFRRNDFRFKNMLGAVLTVGGFRHGGQEVTIQAVHAAMLIHGMIIVGDGLHFGGTAWSNHPEGYEGDSTGTETAVLTGKRIAEVVVMTTG